MCRFNPASSGTGDFVVSGAVPGYQTPSSAGAVNGATYRYRAESADLSQWEVGYGAYNTGTSTLARTTILFSSASNAKVSFTAAPQVAVVVLAEDLGFANGVPTPFSSTLGSDVLLSASAWTTALSVSQGSTGIFLVTSQITIVDTVASQILKARITDGTTVFASASDVNFNASNGASIPLTRIVTNPAGNILLQGFDASGNGVIKFNYSGQSKDTFLDVTRVG